MDTVDLRTPRLLLRPPGEGDVDAIAAACQDPVLQARVPVPVPYTRRSAVDFVRGYSAPRWASGAECTWAIEAEGLFAGMIGVQVFEGGRGEIGYWLAEEHRGRGLLTEAGARVVAFALAPAPEGLGLARLAWRAFSGNVASARVAQRLGFRFEGVARLGAVGRNGLEDDWLAGLLATDTRAPVPWAVLDQHA